MNELEKPEAPQPRKLNWIQLYVLFFGVAAALTASGWMFVGEDLRKTIVSETMKILGGTGRERAIAAFDNRLNQLQIRREDLQLKINIRKRERRLYLLHRGVILLSFPIALGRQPLGQKIEPHDNRTPEGEYRICCKDETARFHLFMGLSYPSPVDAAVALGRGTITATEAEMIVAAWRAGVPPPELEAFGPRLGIHGFGAESDWTNGSIALHNAHMEELFWNVSTGTPVIIEP